MQAGPEHVVDVTPLVGQARHEPPHERWFAGHVAGTQTPFCSSKSTAHVAATQVSFAPHVVVATPVVGHVAQT